MRVMTVPTPLNVCVTRRFSAPPERVFDAWLDPKMIGRWMFGPELCEQEVVRMTVDARVGGVFSFVVRRQGEEIDHTGEYLEIDRPRRLAFTWGVPTYSPDMARVTVEIVPLETGCELMLTHELDPDWADTASRTEAAWTRMLGAMAGVLQ
jgi:uncharacterized protein YndB with AHSA1/START domain